VLLRELARAAQRAGGETVVVTFHSHPRAVVTGQAPPTITSLEHRLVLFERAGIDHAVVLTFNRMLKEMPAEVFLRQILCAGIGVHTIVLGADAHFGRGREGNLALLEKFRPELGFELVGVDLASAEGAPGVVISSTEIREAILEGALDRAAGMLGRSVSLLGRVVRGEARGRTIGFPTANLELHQEICPPRGVYAGQVEVDGELYKTMQNIGVRPTFTESGAPEGEREILEVHLIGFEGNLYGRVLDVQFFRRLRDERRFESVDELKAQLALDREAALAP
jgi:riboflavin kinase/FMN adenylyltransferase